MQHTLHSLFKRIHPDLIFARYAGKEVSARAMKDRVAAALIRASEEAAHLARHGFRVESPESLQSLAVRVGAGASKDCKQKIKTTDLAWSETWDYFLSASPSVAKWLQH